MAYINYVNSREVRFRKMSNVSANDTLQDTSLNQLKPRVDGNCREEEKQPKAPNLPEMKVL